MPKPLLATEALTLDCWMVGRLGQSWGLVGSQAMESNERNMDTETYLKVDTVTFWEHEVGSPAILAPGSFILNSKASYVVGIMAF